MLNDSTRRFLVCATYAGIAGLTAFLVFAWPRLVLGGIGRVFAGRW